MAKYTTVTKEINGKKYTAQFNGISAALRAVDSCYIEGSSNTSLEKLATYLFEHVIVEPKGLTVDDFDSIKEMNAVVNFASSVMNGDFREEKVGGATKAADKK